MFENIKLEGKFLKKIVLFFIQQNSVITLLKQDYSPANPLKNINFILPICAREW